jgi:hypothetical protein
MKGTSGVGSALPEEVGVSRRKSRRKTQKAGIKTFFIILSLNLSGKGVETEPRHHNNKAAIGAGPRDDEKGGSRFLACVGRSRNNVGPLPGISLGTGGGLFFVSISLLEAFFTWGW